MTASSGEAPSVAEAFLADLSLLSAENVRIIGLEEATAKRFQLAIDNVAEGQGGESVLADIVAQRKLETAAEELEARRRTAVGLYAGKRMLTRPIDGKFPIVSYSLVSARSPLVRDPEIRNLTAGGEHRRPVKGKIDLILRDGSFVVAPKFSPATDLIHMVRYRVYPFAHDGAPQIDVTFID